MTSPDQLDGGIDEQDRDSTEAALAAAIAALLAAKAAGAPWLDLVAGSLSGLIQDYLRRASLDMAIAGGMTPTEAAIAADDATAAVMGDVSRHTASWLAISAKDHQDPKAPGSPMSQDDAEQAGALIARSIATYARERAREDIARKLGATRKRWQTRGDSAVRPAHAALQGAWKPLNKPFKTDGFELMYPGDPEAPPELTINCFPAGTMVSSPALLERSYKRWYEGFLIRINLASGVQLAGTPNHPVLTTTGWQPLQNVNVGTELFKASLTERMGFGDPVVGDAPTEISEVHHTAAQTSMRDRVRVRTVDFHGDGGGSSEVQVVSSYWPLRGPSTRDRNEPLIGLHDAESQRAGNSGELSAALEPHRDRLIHMDTRPGAVGSVSSLGVGQPLLEWSTGHPGEHGLRSVALDASSAMDGLDYSASTQTEGLTQGEDALPVQVPPNDLHLLFGRHLATHAGDSGAIAKADGVNDDAPNGGDADAVNCGDVLLGLSLRVSTDYVVSIQTEWFSGHVYNLQTETGWYIANSIPVSNCRCHLIYTMA